MAQSEYLCLERRLRAKPPEEHPPDQVEQVAHRAFITRFGPSGQADGICGSHSAAERQGSHKQQTDDAFHETKSFGWRMRGYAAAFERRSHSSKPIRPRRASASGTSECSSTRPPQYRAPGSLTTSRGSPTAFR